MIKRARTYAKDPLYKNSFYIMLTSVTGAGFGFIFWVLAAKLYPHAGDVGIATALISATSFLILLTRFGLDASIIRFFPVSDKSSIFNTALLITTTTCVLLGAAFILGIDVFSPNLSLLKEPANAGLFLLFLAASSILSIINVAFIALRRAEYQLLQSMIFSSRILLLVPLIFLGALGIFSSIGIASIISIFALLYYLLRQDIRLGISLDGGFLKKTFGFSAGNYLSGLLSGAPAQILPLLVLNVLGPADTAYYYIAYSIASLLYTIPYAVSTSLFVEGSHGEALKKTVIKALKSTLVILIPAILLLYYAAGFLLGLIGKNYSASGLELLKTMTIASIPLTVNSIYMTINRIQKDTKELVYISALIFVLLPATGYFFMLRYGLTGIGYAWIISHTIVAAIVILRVKRNKWI